ncbi:MAG: hypothetical protein WAM79_00605 [Candidatus Sulfotelmatobacter sp.]
MSRQSDQAPDLPYSDELNPLLNPLLSENMGRWADVYFNNPPEHREQAVLSLVQELLAEKKNRETEDKTLQPGSEPEEAHASESERSSGGPVVPTSDADLVHCQGCGHENPSWHKFCGMCGAAVVQEEKDPAPAGEPESTSSEREKVRAESHSPSSDARQADTPRESNAEPEPFENSISNPHELSLFRSFREADSSAYEDSEPHSHFRLYLGVALALVILGLAYMGWKNGLFTTQSSQESLPPTSSATQPNAPPEPAPTKAGAPGAAAAANNENPPAAKKAEARESAPAERKKAEAQKIPAEVSAIPKPARQEGTADHGNEELVTAETYLNGTGGQKRNSALAAQWLWKSIAKHNGSASVLLADLYLKGDGVSKNCDQARVLLDSAAMKGVPGAGERLRNLQAFGCQ